MVGWLWLPGDADVDGAGVPVALHRPTLKVNISFRRLFRLDDCLCKVIRLGVDGAGVPVALHRLTYRKQMVKIVTLCVSGGKIG